MQTNKSTAQRGQIIRVLNIYYPNAISESQLQASIKPYGQIDKKEFEKNLAYILEKGYARKLYKIDAYILSHIGIDLVEGRIEDDGILV